MGTRTWRFCRNYGVHACLSHGHGASCILWHLWPALSSSLAWSLTGGSPGIDYLVIVRVSLSNICSRWCFSVCISHGLTWLVLIGKTFCWSIIGITDRTLISEFDVSSSSHRCSLAHMSSCELVRPGRVILSIKMHMPPATPLRSQWDGIRYVHEAVSTCILKSNFLLFRRPQCPRETNGEPHGYSPTSI